MSDLDLPGVTALKLLVAEGGPRSAGRGNHRGRRAWTEPDADRVTNVIA
jgi:hypothetical protein